MLIKHLFTGAGDKTTICALKNTVIQLLIFAKFGLGTEGKIQQSQKKKKNDKLSVKFIVAATECFWILALGNLIQQEQKKKQTILTGSRGTWRPESLPCEGFCCTVHAANVNFFSSTLAIFWYYIRLLVPDTHRIIDRHWSDIRSGDRSSARYWKRKSTGNIYESESPFVV